MALMGLRPGELGVRKERTGLGVWEKVDSCVLVGEKGMSGVSAGGVIKWGPAHWVPSWDKR